MLYDDEKRQAVIDAMREGQINKDKRKAKEDESTYLPSEDSDEPKPSEEG